MSDTPVPSAPTPSADRAQFWRDTIAAFTQSGQSVRDFCRARGLHEKRFDTWRRNLGLSSTARSTPPGPARIIPGFVPVRVVADATAEVTLPGGLTLRVPVSADPAHVARLAAALRGVTC